MIEKQETISKAHLAAAHAVDQLRRQLGIVFKEDNGKALGACPVEGLTEGLLARLRALPQCRLHVLVSGARARSLGFDTGGAKALCMDAQNLSLAALQALADPLADQSALPKLAPLPSTSSQAMLLRLAIYAGMLPSMLVVESAVLPEEWVEVSMADAEAYWRAPQFEMLSLAQAALPVAGAENAAVTCFRERYGTSVHLALVIGEPNKTEAPLVRIHSSCVTGDILGSLRCDCGDQLKLAIEHIAREGSGVLLYLHQEGRGIGIANKLRAYRLQEEGFDTYDANLMLGFEEDERDFAIAGAMLEKLGLRRVRLLTNNPQKLSAMKQHGVDVKERVALVTPAGRHNHAYLEAKAKKSGHLFN